MKALVGNINGEWELRTVKPNSDGSYSVGKRDYIAKPEKHIKTLKIKTAFGYKRVPFFAVYAENPIPIEFERPETQLQDTSEQLRNFRRAHVVEALGRASRQQPGNNKDNLLKVIVIGGIAVFALIAYYTGMLDQLIAWLTGA